MNSIKTIIKFELIRYLKSPLALIYLLSYLLLSSSCAVYFGNFFKNDSATLWSLFDYQPWMFLLFIPAVSMRSWAEEFKNKTIIQILTTPIPISNFVIGKFFASWIFIVFSIMLTFPFWITVNLLGEPDNTVIFISYIASFTLAGAILAISQTMSSLTKSPIVALVLSIFINLLFFWSGFEYVLFWARELFNDTIIDTIISFSFLNHFISFSRGLIELRDIIYFASLIIFFNLTTISIISLKTKGASNFISSSNTKQATLVFSLLFIGFFGINIIANNLFRQVSFDFTEEKHLSLTKNTKDILKNLERPIIAKLYYSPILEKRNPQIRQYFDKIKLMLKQYKTYAKGNFDYTIYNPEFLDKNEDKALGDGLQPIPLIDINQNALFGITFSDNLMNKSVIPFFALERQPYLEQDLTTNIYKINHNKKTIGILSSLPVGGQKRIENVSMKKWEIIKQIEQTYNTVLIKSLEDLDKKFDALMIIHPYAYSDEVAEKIKQHNNILLLLDVVDDAARLYSPDGVSAASSDISTLAEYWGIDFYQHAVVADFDNSITVDETVNNNNPSFTQDLLQFKVTPADFNPNHRISYNLNNVLFSTASIVMPKVNANVLFFPLIKASNKSSLLNAQLAKKSATPKEILEKFKPVNDTLIIAAEFLSNNPNKPFNIIAVGDTDFIYDSFWANKKSFLNTSYLTPIFDNANFILNSLDYLTKNNDLISLRGKSEKTRRLTKVEKLRKNNLYKYKIKENDIFGAINSAKSGLKQVLSKREFENRKSFSADELAIIGKIRNDISELKQQLSNLKQNNNNNIESLEIKIKFFNIYFIPLLIMLLVVAIYIKSKKVMIFTKIKSKIINKQIVLLSIYTLLITLLASTLVYYDNTSNITTYENKPVFKNFNNTINNIAKIEIRNSNENLNFAFKNSVWILENNNEYLVYQERINNLLLALNNMTFYEKKSDKLDDMKYFGFSSIKDENSPMINIILKDDKNNHITSFDIGWYDIDLGRGSKAAFIRLENKFQVWMVEADFYDLSLDIDEWTYSSLWNLRYGRLNSYNNITEENKVINLAKHILNIKFINITTEINADKIANIELKTEYDNFINIIFYKSNNDKYYVKYDFIKPANGKHLESFANYSNNKYFEISQSDWNIIKNETAIK